MSLPWVKARAPMSWACWLSVWTLTSEKLVPKAKLCGVQDVVRLLQAGKKIEVAQKDPVGGKD